MSASAARIVCAPVRECVCRRGTPGKAASDGAVRVSRETQGRKGKGVTVISGLGLPPNELDALATELKKLCGSGGPSTTAASRSRAIIAIAWSKS